MEAKVNVLAHEYYGNMSTGNMLSAGKPDWSQDACKVWYAEVTWDYNFSSAVNMHLENNVIQSKNRMTCKNNIRTFFLHEKYSVFRVLLYIKHFYYELLDEWES